MTLVPFPWPAPAKINLFLHITGRRDDGYHLLQTVFQFIDYGDTLYFRLRSDATIRRENPLPGVAENADLVVRAARLLQQHTRCSLGADIRLDKRLPMGGGLGGGVRMPPPPWWRSITCGGWGSTRSGWPISV